MHTYRRRQKDRANRSQFASLVATPAVGPFTMPANGCIRFVATAGATAGNLAATLVGPFYNQAKEKIDREIRTPALAAGGYVKLDRIEEGVQVEAETGYDVQLDVGQGVWRKIAEGA